MMSKKWIIILSALGGLLVVFIVLGVIAMNFLKTALLPELAKTGVEEQKAGLEFAKTHLPSACVVEALRRNETCEDFMCHVGARVFLKTCLKENPRKEPALCKDVPQSNEILKSVSWGLGQCANLAPQGDAE